MAASELVDRASERAKGWRQAQHAEPSSARADRLTSPQLRDFTADIVDALLRPDSFAAAATHLQRVARDVPQALPWYVRLPVRAGGAVAPVLPVGVVPLARTALRTLIGDVLVDARPKKLDKHLAEVSVGTVELALLTQPALGEKSALRNRETLAELIARDDVAEVSFQLRHLVFLHSPWGVESAVAKTVAELLPLYEAATAHDARITIEVRELRDIAIVTRSLAELLANTSLRQVSAGVGIAVALAGAQDLIQAVASLSADHADEEGVKPLTIRLIDGQASHDELIESIRNGWHEPAVTEQIDISTAMVRGINSVLALEDSDVRLAVFTSDVDVLAYAVERVEGSEIELDVVLRYGTDAELAKVIDQEARVIVHAPAVFPQDIDAAAAQISQLLAVDPSDLQTDENAAQQHFASLVEQASSPAVPAQRSQDRALAPADPAEAAVRQGAASDSGDLTQAVIGIARSSQLSDTTPLAPDVENMLFGGASYVETAIFTDVETSAVAYGAPGFRNEPQTDPNSQANVAWAQDIFKVEPGWQSKDDADDLISVADAVTAIRHGEGEWEVTPASERALVLERIAYEFELRRRELIITAMASGVLFADADRDVTAAVDFARYYAATVRELDSVSGAVMVPAAITAISVAAADAIASLAEAMVASLAAGGAAIVLSNDSTRVFAEALVSAARAAGVPDDAVFVASGTSEQAVTDGVDSILIAGSMRDVSAAIALNPTRGVNGKARGTNTIIVTPSADIDTTVQNLVRGAFARAGGGYDNTNIAVLVGSVARSSRLLAALVDATQSLLAASPADAAAQLGPLVSPPSEDDLWALTELEAEQTWLVEPQKLEDNLWTPGIRTGVEPGSRFATQRFTVPVLGIISAPSVTAAIDIHNQIAAGAVAVLETTDARDLALWLRHVQAGSLFVGRSAIGPVAQRQPDGGWNAAAAGSAAKAGGPNRLVSLGSWRPTGGRGSSGTLHLRGLDTRVTTLIEAAQPDLDYEAFDWVRRGALSDALVWDREFGHVRDVTRLGVERNLFRYRPATVAVRATSKTPLQSIVRLVVAALRARSEFTLSAAEGLPAGFRRALGDADVSLFVETDEEFVARVVAGQIPRARLAGPGAVDVAAALRSESNTRIYADAVTTAGRVELLAYLREQSVTVAGRALALFREVI